MFSPKSHRTVRVGVSINWITRPDEITEKESTNKGATELSNILTGWYSFDCAVT